MGKSFILLLVCTLLIICTGSAQKAADFNGWEFLHWDMPADSVQVILDRKNSEFDRANALDADFKFHGMNTWLSYDTNNQLSRVRQRAEFSVNHDKVAKEFYEETLDHMIRSYGKPVHKEISYKEKEFNLTWELKYTRIQLNYDYRYKIIDEFGAGSYWVDIVFEPR